MVYRTKQMVDLSMAMWNSQMVSWLVCHHSSHVTSQNSGSLPFLDPRCWRSRRFGLVRIRQTGSAGRNPCWEISFANHAWDGLVLTTGWARHVSIFAQIITSDSSTTNLFRWVPKMHICPFTNATLVKGLIQPGLIYQSFGVVAPVRNWINCRGPSGMS